MAITVTGCELCETPGGEVLHQGAQFRVVLVDDAHYPGFCRVIWRDHAKEMTDLPELDRMLLMDVLWQVEQVVREVRQPEKVNLASFGNMVPHLHWHVIPRYTDDAHFPESVWGPIQRTGAVRVAPDNSVLASAIDSHLAAHATALTQQPR